MPAAGEKFWHFETVKTEFPGEMPAAGEKNWHFEVVKTGFTRGNTT